MAPQRPGPVFAPAFLDQARWMWWHPVLWLGTAAWLIATVVLALRADVWAESQAPSVPFVATTWWSLAAAPVALAAVVVPAVWAPDRPTSAQHVLWRAACNCFVVGLLGLVALLVATGFTDGGSERVGDTLLMGYVTTGVGFLLLGVLVMIAASMIDAQRRKGRLLSPWDLASLPALFLGMVGWVVFGALAAADSDEGPGRWFRLLVDIALTMVGAAEPVRPGWLVPTWIAFLVLVVSLVHARRLRKRVPDL